VEGRARQGVMRISGGHRVVPPFYDCTPMLISMIAN